MKYLILGFFLLLSVVSARADSIEGESFNLNNMYFLPPFGGTNLASNPGVTLTSGYPPIQITSSGSIFPIGASIDFWNFGFLPGAISNGNIAQPTVGLDLFFEGQQYTTIGILPQVSYGIYIPNYFADVPIPVVLAATVFDSAGIAVASQSYDFNILQPTPEPGTFLFSLLGCFALVGYCQLRRSVDGRHLEG